MEDYIRAKFYCLYALADGNQCIQADAKVHLNSITYTASLLSSTWTYTVANSHTVNLISLSSPT